MTTPTTTVGHTDGACLAFCSVVPRQIHDLFYCSSVFMYREGERRDACEDQRVDRSIVSHLEVQRPTALAGSIASASLMLVNVVVEEALRTEPVGVDYGQLVRSYEIWLQTPAISTTNIYPQNSEMFRQVLAHP